MNKPITISKTQTHIHGYDAALAYLLKFQTRDKLDDLKFDLDTCISHMQEDKNHNIAYFGDFCISNEDNQICIWVDPVRWFYKEGKKD